MYRIASKVTNFIIKIKIYTKKGKIKYGRIITNIKQT